jgi:hypothetical protein
MLSAPRYDVVSVTGMRSSTKAPKLKIKPKIKLTCRNGGNEASESDEDHGLDAEVELELHDRSG